MTYKLTKKDMFLSYNEVDTTDILYKPMKINNKKITNNIKLT